MEKNVVIKLQSASVNQRENTILSNVNIEIHEGEFVYVVGKVGTGKTSLIKALHAEIPIERGEATVVGTKLNGIRLKEIPQLRRKIGVVFQDFRLLNDRTVYNNLAFVLKATGWKDKKLIDKRIVEVLLKVGMEHKKNKMPHQLSGGEQQRIAVARAILNEPTIILADEPTGNLDPYTSEVIIDLLIDLNKKGITVIMATHDYASIAKHPARTLTCVNGRIKDSLQNKTYVDFDKILEEN